MDDDILERLRNRYPDVVHPHLLTDAELIGAAVVEIERLRAELQQSRLNHLTTLSELQDAAEQSRRLRAGRDAERALADQLFNTLDAYYRLGSLMMDPLLRRVFNDYKEARHG